MKSNKLIVSLAVLGLLATTPTRSHAQDADAAQMDPWAMMMAEQEWVVGPGTGDMGNAEMAVPEGYLFTGAQGTKNLLQAMGNIIDGDELGFLMHTNADWFVVYEFSDSGYVKDDDKDELDAAELLEAFKEGNEYANEERARMGLPPLNLIGWEQEPKYNESTHNLEWALRLESGGEPVINYNTRLLGRRGVMEVSLVIDPSELQAVLPTYQELLNGYSYKTGESYAEYREGDKLAKYGLAALVLGGAAAGAAKLGLLGTIAVFFKKAWKLVIIGLAAVGAFVKKLFSGRQASE